MARQSVKSTRISSKDRKVLAAVHSSASRGQQFNKFRMGTMPSTSGFAPGYGMRGNKGEKKVIETTQASYAVSGTGTVTLLNGVAVGTDYTDRVGRLAKMESVQLRGIVRTVDNNTNESLGRILLVWDSQPNGAAIATIADILSAATACSFNNLTNRDRFKILRDHHIYLPKISDTATQSFATGSAGNGCLVNDYVRLGEGYVTQFGGTTAAIGSIQHGALLLVTIGSEAAADGGSFVAAARVRFTDA